MPLGEGKAKLRPGAGAHLVERLEPAEPDRPVERTPLEGDIVVPVEDPEPEDVGHIVGPGVGELIVGGDPGIHPPFPLVAEEVDDHVRRIDLRELIRVTVVELPEAGAKEPHVGLEAQGETGEGEEGFLQFDLRIDASLSILAKRKEVLGRNDRLKPGEGIDL